MNYAKYYREPQVADGWLPLVQEMLENLKDFPITIIQIKEKFGQLRVYYEYCGQERNVHDINSIASAIELAQYKAANTCEICGEPGKLMNINVLGVRCEAHANY